jgi:electron transport complex protein RnfB
MGDTNTTVSRRDFLRRMLRPAGALAIAGGSAAIVVVGKGEDSVWQIDPYKCSQCGRCATSCVLSPSAVKCVHAYARCWYCDLCGGYHQSYTQDPDTAAEHQHCPTSAINRSFVEHPFYKYDIDEEKCIGCGLCVKGCAAFGNGSLFLQVRHDRCANCNECAIARDCPSQAVVRVPASEPYIIKTQGNPSAPTLPSDEDGGTAS